MRYANTMRAGTKVEPTSYCKLELVQETHHEKKPVSDKTKKKVKSRNPDFDHNWNVYVSLRHPRPLSDPIVR